MLARGALSRLAAEVPKQATHDLPKLASLVQNARTGFSLPVRTLAHVSQLQPRSYVTKAAQDPAAPVKKAVKARAAAGKSVTKTVARKKASPSSPETAKKRAAPKKKAVPKKPKKKLTDEEKFKAVIRDLKKIALREPVSRSKVSAYNVYIAETSKKGPDAAPLGEAAAGFKDISPAEREKWNHLAAERNEARKAEYSAWVKSYTPDEIRRANNARVQLRKKFAGKFKGTVANTRSIDDDRMPKRPRPGWTFFFSERQASSDFQGISVPERSRLISAEWKALNASEKQRFEDQGAADKERYNREMAAHAKAA